METIKKELALLYKEKENIEQAIKTLETKLERVVVFTFVLKDAIYIPTANLSTAVVNDLKNLAIFPNPQIKLFEAQTIFLQRIIQSCKTNNVEIVFMISPIFNLSNDEILIMQQLKEFADANCIYFKDFSNNPNFYGHQDLFKDNLHLNFDGAIVFSTELSYWLQNDVLQHN